MVFKDIIWKERTKRIQILKSIAKEIVTLESEKNNINIEAIPLTIVEYYKSEFFKKNFVLLDKNRKEFNNYILGKPFYTEGFYNHNKKQIIVFIKKVYEENFDLILINFINCLYHEIRHVIQHRDLNNASYQSFIFSMERFIKYFDAKFYDNNHDDFFMEIDAHLCGITNTIDYLEKNNLLKHQHQENLEYAKKIYQDQFDNYNIDLFIQRFNNIVKNNFDVQINNFDNWISVFYNQDKSFKSLEQISKDPKINYINSKFLKFFITSEDFIESIDFNSLDHNYQSLIMNLMDWKINHYQARLDSDTKRFEEGLITENGLIKRKAYIYKKITYYTDKKRNFMNIAMNQYDNDLDVLNKK